MAKVLRVGDPHAQYSNLGEMKSLIDFVCDLAKKHDVDRIEVMGDLFHNHYMIRLEVMNFWMQAAKKMGQTASTYLLVGNHDQKGDQESEGFMSALDCLIDIPGVRVVSQPILIDDTLLVPHTSSEETFFKWTKAYEADYLVCHQTFDGSKYDNGMYAPDGFSLESVAQFKLVYSGHIHTSQRFSNVFYVGTPRWDSISDAGQDKGVWICEGSKSEFISTKGIVSEIKLFDILEGDPLPSLNPQDRNYVVLKGSSAWIAKKSKELLGLARVTPRPTDALAYSESRKAATLNEFADKFNFIPEAPKEAVLKYIGNI